MTFEKSSFPIEVKTVQGIKTLYMAGKSQSAINISQPNEQVFFYTNYFLLPLFATTVKRVLFIGGGGFSGPKLFDSLGIDVTAVELYSDIVEIAKKEFALDDSKIHVHISDGREYLEKTKELFDVIVVDVFIADKIPLQFTTIEWFDVMKKHLTPNGFVVQNIISSPQLWFCQSMYRTAQECFSHVVLFDTDKDAIQTKNLVLLASNNSFSLDAMKANLKPQFGNFDAVFNSKLEYVEYLNGEILKDNLYVSN